MKKILLLTYLIFLYGWTTAAIWKNFKTSSNIPEEHLDGSQVIAIEFDNDGTVWIGTSKFGALHFTPWSYHWEKYSDSTTNFVMPTSEVRAIALDNDGSQWFGTKAGLIHKVGENLTVYTTSNSNIPSNKINVLRKATDGTIWVCTDNGIMKIANGQWSIMNSSNSGLPDNNVSALEFAGNDIWIGTYNAGVVKFDGTNWVAYNFSTGDFYSNQIYSIGILGNAVIARVAEHISIFQDGVWDTISTDTSIIGLPNLFNRRIVVDQEGNFWTEHGQLGLQSYNSGFFTSYNDLNSGLIGNKVFVINIDPNNTLWLGCDGGNLNLYNPNGIPAFIQSISNDTKLIKTKIFPNPVSETLNIITSTETEISVYDSYGKLISNSQENSQNASDWKQGIYFLEVRKAGLVNRLKFIKI